MDTFLIDYLQCGEAWLLIGSGPSIEMGYPSWKELANAAAETARSDHLGSDLRGLEAALRRQDYPRVFQEAKQVLGSPRLREVLREKLRPSRPGKIYEMIARWPIPVYLTTNYDNEMANHLASLALSYPTYSNSEDHLDFLVPGFSPAIVKLHGDLTSENGLVLTSNDYRDVTEADKWGFWRSKMTAVFQMNRVIVLGHSLLDPDIKDVLEAAKKGTRVNQPVCWIAPNISEEARKEFLEKYRIRVITYDNRDGSHKNLLRLVEAVGEFVAPRSVIQVQEQIAKASQPPHGAHAAAAGFFVFNVCCAQEDFEQKRVEIVASAIQSTLPEIISLGEFTFVTALEMAGWPKNSPPDTNFAADVRNRVVELGLFARIGDRFRVTDSALAAAQVRRKEFDRMRDFFRSSLSLRARRDFPTLNDEQASRVAADIESSLIDYFWEGGLTLTSLLFSSGRPGAAPRSLVPFLVSASTRYDDLTMRQAFFKTSLDAFVHSESAERVYLGRISQGFFAFHALGVHGDVAIDRLKLAKETVWLVDSDTQIRILALGSSGNSAYRDCVSRLKALDLRFFTTSSLLVETSEHLRFADNVIRENGPDSPYVIAGAKGETPYRKQNQFLEGFIRWQAAGNPCNWQRYLFEIFGRRNYGDIDFRATLREAGIEAVDLPEWPGFTASHYHDVEEYTQTEVLQLRRNLNGKMGRGQSLGTTFSIGRTGGGMATPAA